MQASKEGIHSLLLIGR